MQWKEQKLLDIASVFTDGDWVESRDQSSAGILLVQTGNVGVISYRDKEVRRFVSEETFLRFKYTEIYPGDILISRLPYPVGRACIVPEMPFRMITAVDCTILRPQKEYDARYINYLLNAKPAKSQVYRMLAGSSRKRISRKNLAKVELPIPFKNGKPDLAEQKRIADKLDTVSAESEKGQNKASETSREVAAFGKSLLQEIFSNPDWQSVKLGDYFDIAWGNTSITKKSYVVNGHTAYSATGPDGFLEHYEHDGQGIVLSAIGARCGKCFLADGKWTAIKNTIVMKANPEQLIDYKYAWYFLNDEKKWRSRGMGQPFITQGKAVNMELPVPLKNGKPDPSEQKRIVEKLDKAFAHSEHFNNLLEQQNELFASLKLSVLNQSFQNA